MKEKIREIIKRLSEQLCAMSDEIFDYNEPAFQEVRSSGLLADYLEANGFQVERGIAEIDTAFRAVWEQGTGGPSIGLLAEYDALEGLGHACGICKDRPFSAQRWR